MNDSARNASAANSVELVITRIFDAPRELVYQAFVDPDQLAAWFGPVGYTVPRESVDIDARVGGHQRFVMVSDDNPQMRSPVDAQLTEVIPNELIVGIQNWEHIDGAPGPAGRHISLRLEFHDEGGKTRLVLRQGPYAADMEHLARMGWDSSFTRLDELLAG